MHSREVNTDRKTLKKKILMDDFRVIEPDSKPSCYYNLKYKS